MKGIVLMATAQWIKKLGEHAGVLFVCGELSKRGIPNALLPEDFSDNILVGSKDGLKIAIVQIKSFHPYHSKWWNLQTHGDQGCLAGENELCVLVDVGRTWDHEAPRYWIASKREIGEVCIAHRSREIPTRELRLKPTDLPEEWENRWSLFDQYLPPELRLSEPRIAPGQDPMKAIVHVVHDFTTGVALLDLRFSGYERSFAGAKAPTTFLPS